MSNLGGCREGASNAIASSYSNNANSYLRAHCGDFEACIALCRRYRCLLLALLATLLSAWTPRIITAPLPAMVQSRAEHLLADLNPLLKSSFQLEAMGRSGVTPAVTEKMVIAGVGHTV